MEVVSQPYRLPNVTRRPHRTECSRRCPRSLWRWCGVLRACHCRRWLHSCVWNASCDGDGRSWRCGRHNDPVGGSGSGNGNWWLANIDSLYCDTKLLARANTGGHDNLLQFAVAVCHLQWRWWLPTQWHNSLYYVSLLLDWWQPAEATRNIRQGQAQQQAMIKSQKVNGGARDAADGVVKCPLTHWK
eukprot:SAG31_NODE_1942_length_6858_cov_7.808404_3_plen_187_part_00